MFFWFKKKKIVLDCFTHDPYCFEYTRVERSVKFFPEWFKRLPAEVSVPNEEDPNKAPRNLNTVKICEGLLNLYRNSFIIPMDASIRFDATDNKEKGVHWGTVIDKAIHNHRREQALGFLPKEDISIIKFNSGWSIKTKHYLNCVVTEPVWNLKAVHPYKILPGVVNYKYTFNTDGLFLIPHLEQSYMFYFEPGDPLLMVTPITEQEWELKHHLVTENEYRHRFGNNLRFRPKTVDQPGHFMYKHKQKFIDNHYEQQEKSKCPFGFK